MAPTKFVLEIDLGNEAMVSNKHIKEALKKVAKQLSQMEMSEGMYVKIRDVNGNSVGTFGYE